MRTIVYGEKKQEISTLVLGLMRIKNLSEKQVEDLLDTALASGVNAFDIADIYGGDGDCETLLGNVFEKRPDLRNKIWLQSKCGIVRGTEYNYFDFSKEHILEAVDGILARLKTDHLDSLLLHRPDALMEPKEIGEAFQELYKQGKVLSFGVSNMNPQQMKLVASGIPYKIEADQVQLSLGHTQMIDAGLEVNMDWDGSPSRDNSILEYCRRKDIVIQTWSSLQYGFIEGTFLGSPKFEKLNEALNQMAEEKNVTPAAIALAWILRIPGRTQAIVGTTKPYRVAEMAKAMDITLTRKEWYGLYVAAGHKIP